MSLIDLEIAHQEIKQSLSISIEGTKFKLHSSEKYFEVELIFQDFNFNTEILSGGKKTALIQKKKNMKELLFLNFSSNQMKKKIKLELSEIMFQHEINVLIMINELMKLKEK